jgi:hypothetical protein
VIQPTSDGRWAERRAPCEVLRPPLSFADEEDVPLVTVGALAPIAYRIEEAWPIGRELADLQGHFGPREGPRWRPERLAA